MRKENNNKNRTKTRPLIENRKKVEAVEREVRLDQR